MKILTTFITCLIALNLSAQTPSILWYFDTKDSSFGQTAMGDINNDGSLNLVFGCYRNDSMVYALNASNGKLLWKYNTSGIAEGCNDTAPLIYDIDSDGNQEVIVASSCNPITYCFNGANGDIKWQTPTRGSDSPPTIADIDNDGKLDILHGEFGGYVICINSDDGSIKWEILVDENSWIQTAPTILDLDGDGQLDFVVATWNFSDNNKIFAYNGKDQSILWSVDIADYVYHGTAVADLDNDDKPELIIADYSGMLYVINAEDASILWTYEADAYIGSPISIADLDGDGNCELVFVSNYKVIALKSNSELLWEYIIPDFKTSFRGVALSDINDDALPDAIFGTSGGKLIALNGSSGSQIWQLDLAEDFGKELEFDHAPVIGDFDKNGILDVFIVGGKTTYPDFSNNYGRAYAIEAGRGHGPEWTMFQFDERRTSNACNSTEVKATTNIENLSITPNPVKSGQLIKIQLPENKSSSRITIHDLIGRIIYYKTINDSSILIDQNYAPGLYILSITNDKESIQRKLIVE